MFRLRQARPDDHDLLLDLARTGNFINLPPFRERLGRMVERSDASFRAVRAHGTPQDGHDRSLDNYMFVLESDDGACVGTSAIRGGMIARRHPNLSYQLLRVVRESEVLGHPIEGTTSSTDRPIVSGRSAHMHAVLFQDDSLPTEIGGNVLRHDARGRGLGRMLSYARFHYLRSHPEWFSDRILAEMMPPVDGYNEGTPFWRHVVRPFIGMIYDDADRLSTHTEKREFMYALLPRLVNLSLLPDVVLDSIGDVSQGTRPAAEMLRDIGFLDTHRIDPFDGGPHLELRLSELRALACAPGRLASAEAPAGEGIDAMVSTETEEEGFVAVRAPAAMDDGGQVRLSAEGARALGVERGAPVMVSPLRFMPDRRQPRPVPTVELQREMERLRERAGRDSMVSMTVTDMARIMQDKLEAIRRELAEGAGAQPRGG